MVMIIIHIAYITYLVTNGCWHAFEVIGGLCDTSQSWWDPIFRGTGNTEDGWYGYGRGRARNI